MEDFGGNSKKPTWLYSNYQEINDITEFTSTDNCNRKRIKLVQTTRDANGKAQVTGNAHLKASQAYPKQFP